MRLPFDSHREPVEGVVNLMNIEEIRDYAVFNVKCDPEYAIEVREQYSSVRPGYYMNKKHWNTIIADAKFTSAQLQLFIDDSYNLVSPTKKKKKI